MSEYINMFLLVILCLAGLVLAVLILLARRGKTGNREIPAGLVDAISEMRTAKQIIQEKEQAEIKMAENEIADSSEAINTLEKEKGNLEQSIKDTGSSVNTEHARLFSSINNLSLGIVIVDKEKNIRFLNRSAKLILETEKLQDGVSVSDIVKILTNIDAASRLDDALNSAKSFSYEDVELGNSQYDAFISSITDEASKNKDTTGAIILLKDKTEERLLKRSKDNFFIIASHELRTPLTGIRGYIEILKNYYFDKISDQELKRILNDIDASSGRLINIVNDFLDKSKFEEDKISVKLDICDIIPVINSSIQDTKLLAKEKKLAITFDNKIDKASVLGDRDKIKQILINLISNSIKYSDKGSISVQLDRTNDEKYKISISDNGNGIPEENVQFLFSKYQQINTKKGANVVSTGLGLYISKLLAEKMNGDLKLESTKLGIGSTFSLSLPVYHDNS